MRVCGESLVLVKCEPANLCFDQIVEGSPVLRSTFSAHKEGSVVYTEGVDYVVDHVAGTIHRTPASHIPDFSTNMLYGQQDFDHERFPGFSNHAWFVFADYTTTNGQPWARPNDQTQAMGATHRKLEAGGTFRVATYGDSITAGGEASEPRYRFQQRFAHYLEKQFAGVKVEVQDVSISGYSSQQGIDWFDRYMGTADQPDLALVGFGMNDHNIGGPEPALFQANLVTIVKMIRAQKGADVILFSAFPPNDDWHYGSHRMDRFADATRQAAAEAGCGYVDVWSTWEMVLRRKSPSSLLGNNINHPNDFGHWLYAQAFEAMRI
ncbi:MAG: SGNH/GDSL hydrolase family protein [Gemmatimonadetes bacterium]|nr:SGNH/GDSL hydrolase family protein [Gemmatimonadota bacterium]MBT6149718.1 SGNH/GDSL hydrolase family protein [Gemmatimonadota bacterium]MBT7863518.1 SGNH/GDSL hydrolase family protein [Gemmatimonadota bacterium]